MSRRRTVVDVREVDRRFAVARRMVERLPAEKSGHRKVKLEVLLRRAHELVRLDVEHPSAVDGHRRSVGGGGGGSLTVRVPADVHGPAEEVPVTAVELAVMSPPPVDPVGALADRVLRLVEAMASAAGELELVLSAASELRSPSGLTPSMCWVAQLRGVPFDARWAEIHKRTQFEGYLVPAWSEPHPVCRWSYDFVRTERRLPTEEEMLMLLRTGKVRTGKVRAKG